MGPVVLTAMFTSTGGYCTVAVEAVRPSTRSMFAPAGGASSTKFPPASVSVNALPTVTVTPGIGWGTASAVSTRPVMAVVSGASTWSVKAAVRQFLSPTIGGLEGGGWPLEKAVEDREVLVWVARVEGVAKVNQVLLWAASADPQPSVPITGLHLPRLDRLAVAIGAAESVITAAEPPTGKPKRRLPVPTVPRPC